jgi:hypothetical protein
MDGVMDVASIRVVIDTPTVALAAIGAVNAAIGLRAATAASAVKDEAAAVVTVTVLASVDAIRIGASAHHQSGVMTLVVRVKTIVAKDVVRVAAVKVAAAREIAAIVMTAIAMMAIGSTAIGWKPARLRVANPTFGMTSGIA